MKEEKKKVLEAIVRAGIQAVAPEMALKAHVKRKDSRLIISDTVYDLAQFDRVFIAGVGKAAAPMARALEDILEEWLTGGWIVVKYGHGMTLQKTSIFEAGHPIPDDAGVKAGEYLLERLQKCTEKDLVLFVVSGGGSALLPAPDPPVDLAAKQKTTRLLLQCGAGIDEINAVRKHLSRLKGGRLAVAVYPAALVGLILSDVVGDRLDVIASGLTVPDTDTYMDCLEIVGRYGISKKLPPVVMKVLQEGSQGKRRETPQQNDPIFRCVQNVIVGNNRTALAACEKKAAELGYNTLLLTSFLQGEAKEVAEVVAAIGKEVQTSGRPVCTPACILAGGETTVTITGSGRGGRNQELALSAAIALKGWKGIYLLSAGTDGTDGPTDAAGGFADGDTYETARAMGFNPGNYLGSNDSYTFLEKVGGLWKTGPTRTNVMDLVCMVVEQDYC
ncbi:MAG: glycerate kinase type-2 family protein [Spirochaetota bacterium]